MGPWMEVGMEAGMEAWMEAWMEAGMEGTPCVQRCAVVPCGQHDGREKAGRCMHVCKTCMGL